MISQLLPHDTGVHAFHNKIHTSTIQPPRQKQKYVQQGTQLKDQQKQKRNLSILTPCRQYEPLRNSLISCSSVRREM